MITFKRGDQLAVIGFVFVFSIIEPAFEGLRYCLSSADMMGLEINRGYARPPFPLAHMTSGQIVQKWQALNLYHPNLTFQFVCVMHRHNSPALFPAVMHRYDPLGV